MRLRLAALCGLVFLAGCSSVPQQQMRPIEKVASHCDQAQMNRVDRMQQPYLLERYWVNCPQTSNKAKAPS